MVHKPKKQYRLPNYDYSSSGYYFVTLSTKLMKHLFGEIVNAKIKLSAIGRIAKQYWKNIPEHYPYAKLDQFTVMPNHLHGIVIIDHTCPSGGNTCPSGGNTARLPLLPNDPFRNGLLTVSTSKNDGKTVCRNGRKALRRNGQKTVPTPLQPTPKSLSIVIRNYKAAVTTWAKRKNLTRHVWKPRFHDRIIRDHEELERIREYIDNNPAQWEADRHYRKSRTRLHLDGGDTRPDGGNTCPDGRNTCPDGGNTVRHRSHTS